MPNFILPSRSGIPADGAPQEIVPERGEGGALLVVLAVTMSASRRLVEIGLIAHRLQFRCHLAGVAGMDAVVAPARRNQDRWIGSAGDCVVIGRDLAEKFPVFRIVWIAVFGN